METKQLDTIQIRKVGVKALTEALGPVGMVRFLHYFDTGIGDYTKERKKWLGQIDTKEIVGAIKKKRK